MENLAFLAHIKIHSQSAYGYSYKDLVVFGNPQILDAPYVLCDASVLANAEKAPVGVPKTQIKIANEFASDNEHPLFFKDVTETKPGEVTYKFQRLNDDYSATDVLAHGFDAAARMRSVSFHERLRARDAFEGCNTLVFSNQIFIRQLEAEGEYQREAVFRSPDGSMRRLGIDDIWDQSGPYADLISEYDKDMVEKLVMLDINLSPENISSLSSLPPSVAPKFEEGKPLVYIRPQADDAGNVSLLFGNAHGRRESIPMSDVKYGVDNIVSVSGVDANQLRYGLVSEAGGVDSIYESLDA